MDIGTMKEYLEIQKAANTLFQQGYISLEVIKDIRNGLLDNILGKFRIAVMYYEAGKANE